jgi:hypothetical protein
MYLRHQITVLPCLLVFKADCCNFFCTPLWHTYLLLCYTYIASHIIVSTSQLYASSQSVLWYASLVLVSKRLRLCYMGYARYFPTLGHSSCHQSVQKGFQKLSSVIFLFIYDLYMTASYYDGCGEYVAVPCGHC